jgi:hypothetical protein
VIVQIIESATKFSVNSEIRSAQSGSKSLPSFMSGWRFNFHKHSKRKDYRTFTLCTLETPTIIEGCVIINSCVKDEVYMAFVEVAPHNRGKDRKYEKVAGCLIAFACRQSFIEKKGGFVAFDVLEDDKATEMKLMAMYSKKYGALQLENSTTMLILPEGSEKLITDYLN